MKTSMTTSDNNNTEPYLISPSQRHLAFYRMIYGNYVLFLLTRIICILLGTLTIPSFVLIWLEHVELQHLLRWCKVTCSIYMLWPCKLLSESNVARDHVTRAVTSHLHVFFFPCKLLSESGPWLECTASEEGKACSGADNSNFAVESCTWWYKHQNWHDDTQRHTLQICPTSHLKIQDGGHFSRWPPNWTSDNALSHK